MKSSFSLKQIIEAIQGKNCILICIYVYLVHTNKLVLGITSKKDLINWLTLWSAIYLTFIQWGNDGVFLWIHAGGGGGGGVCTCICPTAAWFWGWWLYFLQLGRVWFEWSSWVREQAVLRTWAHTFARGGDGVSLVSSLLRLKDL